jgi:hypothetical protein
VAVDHAGQAVYHLPTYAVVIGVCAGVAAVAASLMAVRTAMPGWALAVAAATALALVGVLAIASIGVVLLALAVILTVAIARRLPDASVPRAAVAAEACLGPRSR